MPTVNFFYSNDHHKKQLHELLRDVKVFLASELTCGDIRLNKDEVSIRFIGTPSDGMIGELEVEITAHAFEDRIKKQDEICLHVRDFIMERIPNTDIRVWLLLPQLGHSWDE